MKRKICIVTATRAEYGILSTLIRQVHQAPDLELQLVATGTHLSPEFGFTYKQILEEGLPISDKLEILMSSDSTIGTLKSLSNATSSFAELFDRTQPDIVVLLGDRYEILGVAQAAFFSRIPIAHIHGGEITEGSFDDGTRHAITKLSHLHFTSTEAYRRRIIQMGESPSTVFNTGAPGLDRILSLPVIEKTDLEKELNVLLTEKSILITFHPETLSTGNSAEEMDEVLNAIAQLEDCFAIFTMPNADPGNSVIRDKILLFQKSYSQRSRVFETLGSLKYINLMRYVGAVAGNSSSGIIEAPFLGTPVVNIGDRQAGRIRSNHVHDCKTRTQDIVKTLRDVLRPDNNARIRKEKSLYGDGNASGKIFEVLRSVELKPLLRKKFHDVPVEA